MPADPKSRALASLAWLVESGADEAIGEAAVDRFQPTASPVPQRQTTAAESRAATARAAAPASTRPSPTASISREAGTDNVGYAMEMAASCNSLAELKLALDGFQGLEIRKYATKTVFADGNPASRIMFIGEAPGRDEDRMGLPFVGRAGKLLDEMLKSIQLDRSSAYITNVLPWRPPDNRNPEATEVAQCIPFLRRHIELVAPGILILLGAVSLRHVLGLGEGIMKYRGRWMEYRVANETIPVMPTLHPAYLLRQPAHKRLAWRDLQAIRERIEQLRLAPVSLS